MSEENNSQFNQYGANGRNFRPNGWSRRFRQGADTYSHMRPILPSYQPSYRLNSHQFVPYRRSCPMRRFMQPTHDINLCGCLHYCPMPQVFESTCGNSTCRNMSCLHRSEPIENQHWCGYNNVQRHHPNQYHFCTYVNSQVNCTSNHMHMSSAAPLHSTHCFGVHHCCRGHGANPVHSHINPCHETNPDHSNIHSYHGININASNNFYRSTQTVAHQVTTGNITSRNTNTDNSYISTPANTVYLNNESAAISQSYNNFSQGNNYQCNYSQSYENWVHDSNENRHNERSNSNNSESDSVEDSTDLSESLSNVRDYEMRLVSASQSVQNLNSESLLSTETAENSSARNQNTSHTSNADELKFVNENLIQIGNMFYSRTVKLRKSVLIKPKTLKIKYEVQKSQSGTNKNERETREEENSDFKDEPEVNNIHDDNDWLSTDDITTSDRIDLSLDEDLEASTLIDRDFDTTEVLVDKDDAKNEDRSHDSEENDINKNNSLSLRMDEYTSLSDCMDVPVGVDTKESSVPAEETYNTTSQIDNIVPADEVTFCGPEYTENSQMANIQSEDKVDKLGLKI